MNVYIYREKIDLSFIKIIPGDSVVIKPNLIKESKETDPNEWESVITSPKIIELVCEDACKKLSGKGMVTICDAPQTDSSFAKIAEKTGLYGIAKRCSEKYSVKVEVLDLRNEEWVNEGGVITERRKLPGDPKGTIAFNLGKDSFFYKFKGEGRYYGADYDTSVVNRHHRREVQEYLISATPVLADVFINLPKMKTHKKTGVTLNLKNLVGINADKNWLPHHTEGHPENGGDQFPEFALKNFIEQWSAKFTRYLALNLPFIGTGIAKKLRRAGTSTFGDGRQVIRSGNWHGNDTTWRMVLDLNKCLLYGNADGTLRKENPKRYYSLIDGIKGMEGMGPMQGEPVNSNIVIGGNDPVAVDTVAARLMGFDWRKIPVIREAYNLNRLPITNISPDSINVISDVPEWNGKFSDMEEKTFFNFKPHFGWAGHIEYEKKY
ncbi:MAG: DUF362 domain-containing protein [Candidatus Schekmanbacteria bacterium]|nr:DUF362 domain-containing protein [Candidatus Schekmanbacteria bacterium]